MFKAVRDLISRVALSVVEYLTVPARGIEEEIRDFRKELSVIASELGQIRRILANALVLHARPVRISIQFEGRPPDMPGQMTDNQTINATIAENDAAGNPVSFDPANIAWTVGDATIAALTQNADGSASFKGVGVGVTSVGVTDKSNGLSAQDTLTVTADAATTLQIKFGTPA